MGLTLGKRLASIDERTRTAIGSMVNGTIAGDSKIGMPIVEPRRTSLAPSGYLEMPGDGVNVPQELVGQMAWANAAATGATTGATAHNAIAFRLDPGTYLVEAVLSLTSSQDPETSVATMFVWLVYEPTSGGGPNFDQDPPVVEIDSANAQDIGVMNFSLSGTITVVESVYVGVEYISGGHDPVTFLPNVTNTSASFLRVSPA